MFVYEEFVKCLNASDFGNGAAQINEVPLGEREEIILRAAYETESIIVYTFVCYLIETEGNFYYHHTAMELMTHPFSHIEGAYSSAVYHLKRLCENDPGNVGYMELILFFWSVPEKLISNDEALDTAKKILEYEPDNPIALEAIAKIGG